jgi:hypothetical protein
MNNREHIIYMFRNGELVFIPDVNNVSMADEEILHNDAEGLLLGALGNATVYGTCSCGWKGHEHFEIGDDEREDAYSSLEDIHEKEASCTKPLSFVEKQFSVEA